MNELKTIENKEVEMEVIFSDEKTSITPLIEILCKKFKKEYKNE